MKRFAAAFVAAALALTGTPAGATKQPQPWWRSSLLYEIYPRSFGDSNGDGVGDLNGITRHLDYMKWLGVGGVWLAPVYPSPQIDFGYDISDYRTIDPQYGTLADFDRLEREASKRGIKVVMDLVLNHTSDKHAWFIQSAASRNNPKSDWYVWSDGVPADTAGLSRVQTGNVHEGRAPPNNWTSAFGGSAWEWVPARRQFYYHRYYRQQPDLNWRNPEVEKAMFDVVRFWLDRGVAGFRLDAVGAMFEDAQLRSEPEAGGEDAFGEPVLRHQYTTNLPEVHAVMRRLRKLVDSYRGDRILLGETNTPDMATLKAWYGGEQGPELHLAMDLAMGVGRDARYSPAYFRPQLKAAETELGGALPLFVFDNHDRPRSIDRFGDGVHDQAIAKGIAAILLASRASPLTYDGAEIGMRTRTPTRKEDVRDPIGIVGWPAEKGRDGERTPMQWTPGPQAGFSTNPKTWLPVDPEHVTINVASERADPGSLLNWYRRLARLRLTEPALRNGGETLVGDDDRAVLAWTRTAPGGARAEVAVNMSGETHSFALEGGAGQTLAASGAVSAKGRSLSLGPYALWIGRLN
jgi:alpha-glucosidase